MVVSLQDLTRLFKRTNKFAVLCISILILNGSSNPAVQENLLNKGKYWVFFTDKGINGLAKTNQMLSRVKETLSSRALKRRAKVRPSHNLVDEHDLPVHSRYVKRLESMGLKPIVKSRWLNAVSVRLDSAQVADVKKLSFVEKIRPVALRVRRPSPDTEETPDFKSQKSSEAHTFDYGPSLLQNDMIAVPQVHDLGIVGKDVWVGMLDTGFRRGGHEAFGNLDVVDEFDFINGDGNTENDPDQDSPSQDSHGTQTLSVVGAFKEGQLIGPAFGARFLLAKTELTNPPDMRAEEDYWVAGIEWMESQGVDIVSSSVGYLDFYVPSDMDGNTAVTTIAADLAVSRGVIVVNSAGNEQNTSWRTIISPADGDSVMAVGAVTSQEELAAFSSVGPSADGRIKPDLVALGVSVRTALPSTPRFPSPFNFNSGTSFSCPLVSGVAALVLSAHPNLTPMQVHEALKMTADRASAPNNRFGWGLVNAYEAVLFHGPAFSNRPEVIVNNSDLEIRIKVASRPGIDPNDVFLFYELPGSSSPNSVPMTEGEGKNQFSATIPDFVGEGVIRFYFTATDSNGINAIHPVDAPDSTFSFPNTPVSVDPGAEAVPSDFRLVQNYPNPFNPTTKIVYELPEPGKVSLNIYNILGQTVRTLVDEVKSAGRHSVSWNARDDAGRLVSAGVYLYSIEANSFADVKKMVFVR